MTCTQVGEEVTGNGVNGEVKRQASDSKERRQDIKNKNERRGSTETWLHFRTDDGHATGPANIRKVGLEQGAQQLSPNWQPVLFCLFGIGPAVVQAELGARR